MTNQNQFLSTLTEEQKELYFELHPEARPKEPERWKPEMGKNYFYITSLGENGSDPWHGGSIDIG